MTTVSFKNHFLIAMPSQEDSVFVRSVIFLCEHNADGAMGLMINKTMPFTLSKVLDHLDIKIEHDDINHIPVYMGGPVSQESGFIIHTPYREDELNEDLVISASKETLTDITKNNGPASYLVTLGYAEWSANQLEFEMNRNDWLLVPYDKDIMFNTSIEQRWEKSIALLGINANQLSAQVGHV